MKVEVIETRDIVTMQSEIQKFLNKIPTIRIVQINQIAVDSMYGPRIITTIFYWDK